MVGLGNTKAWGDQQFNALEVIRLVIRDEIPPLLQGGDLYGF